MVFKVTKEQLIAMRPCNLNKHIALFNKHKELSAGQAFAAGASIRDLLWVAGRLGRKELCVKFALACAVRAGHFTKDRRVHDCLKATQAYIDAPTNVNLDTLKVARRNADAAAYAAAAYAADTAYAERQKEIKAQQTIFIKLFNF